MTAALGPADVGAAPVTTSDLSPFHAQRVAAALDAGEDLAAGDPLPFLWHWAFFAPARPTSSLGPDGHPLLPEGGPTAGLSRRMWVGGLVRQHRPLVLGAPAVRQSTVTGVEQKGGGSGELLVVTLEHEIHQGATLAISERQDLIYRPAATTPVPAPAGDESVEVSEAGWSEPRTIGPVTLFRFSAVTFNSHRIHYDEPYARQEEGYPALVVHGPLTAVLLAGSARAHGADGTNFEYRATAPLFAAFPFSVVGEPDATGTDLRAVRNDGTVAMRARLSST
jgi:hydroxyacyl-ACP dehydratase HTD2-like protein with hotdog domain